ncbi:MAG TPA: TonB-dependent receptor [Candidatus Polarisedimenticolia bacterium]|nr:TonB-dependent receptor [Candidatus Polarisedimenticolia bacterium]
MQVRRLRGRWLVVKALVRLTLLLATTTRVSGEDAGAEVAPGPPPQAPVDPAPASVLTERVSVPGETAADSPGPSQSHLTRQWLALKPAAFGDPFRALTGSAGITSQNDFQSEIRIRGGDPSETAVLVDGLPLPAAFHFAGSGGSAAALGGDLVDEVQVHSGGFSVEYGDALAGVVEIGTGDRRPDRLSGRGEIDTLQGEATLTGPAGDGSWIVSGRAGDLGLYQDRVGENGIQATRLHDLYAGLRLSLRGVGRLDFALLQDGSGFTQALGQADRASMTGSQEAARLRFEAPINARTLFRIHLSDGNVATRSSVTGGALYDLAQSRQDLKLSLLRLVGAGHRIGAGVDFTLTGSAIEGAVVAGYSLVPSAYDDRSLTQGFYLEDRCQAGERVSLRYGVRGDRFSGTGESALSPRVAAELRLEKRLVIRGAAGRFVQFPRPEQLFLATGEPLRRQIADHYILGIEGAIGTASRLVVEGYLKNLINPIGESSNRYIELPEQMTRFDRGRVRGLDVTLDRQGVGPWRLRLDYSYMVAEEMKDGLVSPRGTDQRHTASAMLGRSLGKGWDLSTLMRYGSGLPYTPQEPWTDGVVYDTRLGALNSARLPAYGRIDLRLSRSARIARGLLSVHLDLLNVLNRDNARDVEVFYDAPTNAFYRTTRYQSPFLPVFGLTAEF